MAYNKIERINEDIQRVLSTLLREIKDPRLKQGMVSITAVLTTGDLRYAKVFLSVYGLESEKEFKKGLKSASGYLRRELGGILDLRYTPELIFVLDKSIERGARINTLLNDLDIKTSKMMTTVETATWLQNRDNYLIITHRRPDGDTIGCAGALAHGLRECGKTAYILKNPETTPRYQVFVEEYIAADGYTPENIIIVDTASRELFPENAEEYDDLESLCIDHHPSNTLYADYTRLDGAFASCGEIIYEILLALDVKIGEEIAGKLYVALSTDTGCFAYANTSANTLQVASKLIECGAPHRELNKTLFRTKTRGRMKIEGLILSGLEFHFNDTVAISTITRDMMAKANATEDDVDDISSIPGSIEGVLAGITIREMTSEKNCKVSVRSGAAVNSNDICTRFGGGGHPMAAGFTLEASVAEIKEKLLEALPDYL